MSSLFGHLALRFASSPENLATESLHYILSQSEAAKRVFVGLLRSFDEQLPETMNFKTQATGKDGEIPDLVGIDVAGQELTLVEAKFWAGLTPNQPVAYLKRLPTDGGLLLFVAPARRVEMLWHELLQRCVRDGFVLVMEQKKCAERRLATFEGGQRLAFVSWRNLLETLQVSLTEAEATQSLADLHQLRGLTERMDNDLSLPFTGEELTSGLGMRVWQLCHLVDKIVDRLETIGLVAKKSRRASGGRHGLYSMWFLMETTGCRVYFNPEGWAKSCQPLGIEMLDENWKPSAAINAKLAPLGVRYANRFTSNEWGSWFAFDIRIGVEIDAVIDHIVEQILEVKQLLNASTPTLR